MMGAVAVFDFAAPGWTITDYGVGDAAVNALETDMHTWWENTGLQD